MADIEPGAQALVAGRDEVLGRVERCGLHQIDHDGRRQHADTARADARRGVFLADDQFCVPFKTGLQLG
jgi:hypothetical protein